MRKILQDQCTVCSLRKKSAITCFGKLLLYFLFSFFNSLWCRSKNYFRNGNIVYVWWSFIQIERRLFSDEIPISNVGKELCISTSQILTFWFEGHISNSHWFTNSIQILQKKSLHFYIVCFNTYPTLIMITVNEG